MHPGLLPSVRDKIRLLAPGETYAYRFRGIRQWSVTREPIEGLT
jgi:hypothetical protein